MRWFLKMMIHDKASTQEGNMYGMVTTLVMNRRRGRSVLLTSQASIEPMLRASSVAPKAVTKVLRKGAMSMALVTLLVKTRCQ